VLDGISLAVGLLPDLEYWCLPRGDAAFFRVVVLEWARIPGGPLLSGKKWRVHAVLPVIPRLNWRDVRGSAWPRFVILSRAEWRVRVRSRFAAWRKLWVSMSGTGKIPRVLESGMTPVLPGRRADVARRATGIHRLGVPAYGSGFAVH
jgi:hypothetical protein